MGAWGPAIFSDDLTCDIRNDFKDLIAAGLSSEEVTKKLFDSYDIKKVDPEEYNVFWLSLAATQWKVGRLSEEVKVRAIEIIDNGTGQSLFA
ncbi:MarR family transcriptional regulator [Paenibacillus sp. HWE-109]|uniref:MarR family transcriptional regulator n=1 Tax=Paenibacillus sp. HWE-109 TaxID=1306526 RepID=UPI001EDD4B72|nr:MarR family transcriptional regulator [Paenibacillus sp. HWE-109]UKS27986.1 MarR family transcriptional regulator [Paenibacillus sp. HWE-109]